MIASRLIMTEKNLKTEDEHRGSIWSHPYMVYVILTGVLFTLLVIIGYLAWTQGWIPNQH